MRARAAPSPGPAPTTTARLNMLLTVRYTATRVCKRSTPRLPRGKFPSRAFTRNGERPRRRVSLFETLPRPCIVARVLGWICSVQRSHGYSCSSRSLRPLSPGISTRSSGWTDPVPTRTSSEPVRRLPRTPSASFRSHMLTRLVLPCRPSTLYHLRGMSGTQD